MGFFRIHHFCTLHAYSHLVFINLLVTVPVIATILIIDENLMCSSQLKERCDLVKGFTELVCNHLNSYSGCGQKSTDGSLFGTHMHRC